MYSCSSQNTIKENSNSSCDNLKFDYKNEKGCDGLTYPNPETSPYVLPFPSGISFKTGLTNCSSSYHGAGRTDQYAYDFDVNAGTKFYATRSGVVVAIENSQSSSGGGSGNGVIIDHQDKTFGIYLHSPKRGILVNVGDVIKKGDLLGKVGKSGLAGYPHLHFLSLHFINLSIKSESTKERSKVKIHVEAMTSSTLIIPSLFYLHF